MFKILLCAVCDKYRTIKNLKILRIFEKAFDLSIIQSKYKNGHEKYSNKKNQLRY